MVEECQCSSYCGVVCSGVVVSCDVVCKNFLHTVNSSNLGGVQPDSHNDTDFGRLGSRLSPDLIQT